MASNDGRKLLVFGATMRDHHGLRMKQLLREFRRTPDGVSRAAEFIEMFKLAKELSEDKIEAVQNWLLNGGEFPKWVLPPAAPAPAPAPQQSGHAYAHGHRPQHQQRHTYHDEFDSDEDEWQGYSAANFNARFGAGQVLHMDPDAVRDEEVLDTSMDRTEENEATNDMITEDTSEEGEEEEDDDDWALPLDQPADDDVSGHDQPTQSSPHQPRDPNSTDVECGICAEVLEVTQFPSSNKIMDSCNHDHDIRACFGCLEQHIQLKLDEGQLHLLNCPFCHEIFGYEDVKKYATPEAFARYEYLVMKDSPDVVMCLGRNCNKGQSHTDPNPMMVCNSCQFKICVAHKLPWHEGQTCDEFDMDESQLDRLERDEATAKLLAKEQSKICPNCHQGVTKQEGCDHMMCRCGNAWCFVCMASWDNIMRLGPSAHAGHCIYHPDKKQLRRDQIDAIQDDMMQNVHGGVSNALTEARKARNERVRREVMPLAAAAAERRAQEAAAQKKELEAQKRAAEAKRKAEAKTSGQLTWEEPPKRRPRLLPAWEEK